MKENFANLWIEDFSSRIFVYRKFSQICRNSRKSRKFHEHKNLLFYSITISTETAVTLHSHIVFRVLGGRRQGLKCTLEGV